MWTFICLVLFHYYMTHCDATFCWECTSLNERWCSQHFAGKDMSPYHRQYVLNCTGHCLKMEAYVGYSRDAFYIRTCDITGGKPDTCFTVSHLLGIPRGTVCVCDSNRCNGTSGHSIVFYMIVIMTSLHFVS